MSRRTAIELGVGMASLVVAALLVLVMLQVRPWQRALIRGDARFDAAPAVVPQAGAVPPPPAARWNVPDGVAARVAERLLGLRDDVAYRNAVALYRAAEPSPNADTSDPELPARRIRAQQALAAVGKNDPDRKLRSRATNMLGILIRSGPPPVDPNEQRSQIVSAINLFRTAVVLDPGNADAKLNLELVLTDAQEQKFVKTPPGTNPDVGSRAGTGGAGRGY